MCRSVFVYVICHILTVPRFHTKQKKSGIKPLTNTPVFLVFLWTLLYNYLVMPLQDIFLVKSTRNYDGVLVNGTVKTYM